MIWSDVPVGGQPLSAEDAGRKYLSDVQIRETQAGEDANAQRRCDPGYYPGWEAPKPLDPKKSPDWGLRADEAAERAAMPEVSGEAIAPGVYLVPPHSDHRGDGYGDIRSGHNGELFPEIEQNPAYGMQLAMEAVGGPQPPLPKNTPFPLEELLSGDINRLRHTYRFNTAMVLHRESVAEHTFYVVTYGIILARWASLNTAVRVSLEEVMLKAHMHDWDEARTGDMVRSFKHSSREMAAFMEQAASGELAKLLNALLDPQDGFLRTATMAWWRSKDDSPEGCVVALADYLSVVSHLWQELQAGNTHVCRHYGSMIEHLETFSDKRFDFLRPVISQVDALVRKVLVVDRRIRLPEE